MPAVFSILRLPAVLGLLIALLVSTGCGQATARSSATNHAATIAQIAAEQQAEVIAEPTHAEPVVEQPTTVSQPLLFADERPEPYQPRGPPGLCVLPLFPAPLILPADVRMPSEIGIVVDRVLLGQHIVAWAAISPVGWRVGAVRTVGFRYYNPITGRYISRDPAGYPDGLNNYLYTNNNPINRIDPTGLGWIGAMIRAVKVLFKSDPVPTPPRPPSTTALYHKGELDNGQVSGSRSLSLGTDKESVGALDRPGVVHRFDVPKSDLDQWEASGQMNRMRDLDHKTGVINEEVRIQAPTSAEMNKYKTGTGSSPEGSSSTPGATPPGAPPAPTGGSAGAANAGVVGALGEIFAPNSSEVSAKQSAGGQVATGESAKAAGWDLLGIIDPGIGDIVDAVKANADRGVLGDSGGTDPLMSPSNPNSVNYNPNGVSAPKKLWDKPTFDNQNNGGR